MLISKETHWDFIKQGLLDQDFRWIVLGGVMLHQVNIELKPLIEDLVDLIEEDSKQDYLDSIRFIEYAS
jgi:hypothetical protein